MSVKTNDAGKIVIDSTKSESQCLRWSWGFSPSSCFVIPAKAGIQPPVIPAQAGILSMNLKAKHWIPAFAGMTDRW